MNPTVHIFLAVITCLILLSCSRGSAEYLSKNECEYMIEEIAKLVSAESWSYNFPNLAVVSEIDGMVTFGKI